MEAEGGVVKLNIGGKKFVTTAATLTQGDNFFTRLLSGRIPATKVDGDYYFIDRNGRYFEPILDYLRTERWKLPNHLAQDEMLVLDEAEFYGIDLHPCDVSIRKARHDLQNQRHAALLERYKKAVRFVKETIFKSLRCQLEIGAYPLMSSRICLEPQALAQVIVVDAVYIARFGALVAEHQVVFCEVEAVAPADMRPLVDALLWDCRTNGLSLCEITCELKFQQNRKSRGLWWGEGRDAGQDHTCSRPIYQFSHQ